MSGFCVRSFNLPRDFFKTKIAIDTEPPRLRNIEFSSIFSQINLHLILAIVRWFDRSEDILECGEWKYQRDFLLVPKKANKRVVPFKKFEVLVAEPIETPSARVNLRVPNVKADRVFLQREKRLSLANFCGRPKGLLQSMKEGILDVSIHKRHLECRQYTHTMMPSQLTCGRIFKMRSENGTG